jgi:hypothetical protein
VTYTGPTPRAVSAAMAPALPFYFFMARAETTCRRRRRSPLAQQRYSRQAFAAEGPIQGYIDLAKDRVANAKAPKVLFCMRICTYVLLCDAPRSCTPQSRTLESQLRQGRNPTCTML